MSGSADGGPPEVTLDTSMGPFTVEMYYKHAPKTCRNFVELSRRGYYDNVKFHRIIKDFIVQGGDPTGTGRGGESIYGLVTRSDVHCCTSYVMLMRFDCIGILVFPFLLTSPKFDDEIKPELKHTGAGILSMANAGPNTNGSQFFITLAPCQSLDGKHTIFGRVCRGMEVIKRLGSVQTDNSDRHWHAATSPEASPILMTSLDSSCPKVLLEPYHWPDALPEFGDEFNTLRDTFNVCAMSTKQKPFF
ncbi:hypothetical protein ZIOFF_020949 [Zingiber officinale]|uniref:Peptidyl-prolyl cis-trans isomerase n=1 Tax=Zingiber officinale TaxID=94328 RepID=A0A8J5HI90_ZINOF|nr:hypothetical protein ZIOFF_020949 [Zingiber officinale]